MLETIISPERPQRCPFCRQEPVEDVSGQVICPTASCILSHTYVRRQHWDDAVGPINALRRMSATYRNETIEIAAAISKLSGGSAVTNAMMADLSERLLSRLREAGVIDFAETDDDIALRIWCRSIPGINPWMEVADET